MKNEYEIAALDIDKKEILKKLEQLGATFDSENYQKRFTYNIDTEFKGRFIRLRTNGTKTTLAIKDKSAPKEIGSVKELEFEVQDFYLANEFLETLGYRHTLYQENKKTIYKLNNVEISIDEWPMIPPYIEIEGQSKKAVEQMIDILQIDKSKLTLAKVSEIYNHYGINLHDYPHLDFSSKPKSL